MRNGGVIAVECSANFKIGPVSATYVAQGSCPPSCSWLGAGCYAEKGLVNHTTSRLNKVLATPLELAQQEAEAIGQLSGKRPLRLHVVGDCATPETASIIAEAVGRYEGRELRSEGSKAPPVWSYTHGWRETDRLAWGKVSVLASVETPEDIALANSAGYAAAIVVPEFQSWKRYSIGGHDVIPCPEQTSSKASRPGYAVQCTDCRLCWDDQALLKRGVSIAFAYH